MAKPEAEDDQNQRQDERIEDLKRRAEELCDGQMELRVSENCSAEVEETFWERVVAYEEAPLTTNFHQLESAGVTLPPPDSLDDQELTVKLWEVIHKLAFLRVFIDQTDHLTDRELYSHLWTDVLQEKVKALPPSANSAWHIPLLGACSEEDIQLDLKYYADDDFRQHWEKDFPNDLMPAHEDPPYDRDRFLPKADYGSPASHEPN